MQHDSLITRLAREGRTLDDDELADLYAPPATPWLRVNVVSSLDGAAEVGGVSGPLSGRPDQRMLALLRMRCDALLLGAGTLRVEGYDPPLVDEDGRRWRRTRGMPEHPTLVVVSGSLDLDPAAPAFAAAPARPIVLTDQAAPAARWAALAASADVASAGETSVDLPGAFALLHRQGFREILCEGGPHLLGGLLAAELVDEVCLTLSPLLAGAGAGRIVAGQHSPLRRMSLHQVLNAGDALFLRYLRPSTSSLDGTE